MGKNLMGKNEAAALSELILLHFEVIRAYQAAIKGAPARLRAKLAGLMADHQEHARWLVARSMAAGGQPPRAGEVAGRLAKRVAGARSEARLLGGLLAIEEEAVAAYEQKLSQLPASLPIDRFLRDERRHAQWLARRLGPQGGR